VPPASRTTATATIAGKKLALLMTLSVREGLTRLLAEAGIETCASVGDADALEGAVAEHQPDVAIVDIRMPPTYTHEGARAAIRLRERWPTLAILLLSQSLEHRGRPPRGADALHQRPDDLRRLLDAAGGNDPASSPADVRLGGGRRRSGCRGSGLMSGRRTRCR
jgi:CheY-like chemotaxis protein